jgi:NADH-quinone oxidoreductase subunit L
MLVVAALLTAFYTMRQISLTFLGKPRSPLAEHAHESNRFMTIPLILLAVFAVAAGWPGIPENFPILGGIVDYNYVHHIVGATIYETMHTLNEAQLVNAEIFTLPFQITPVTASLVVALGGLFLGWWIYGRKPLEAGQADPLMRPLGPLYTFLNRKWYWDELYDWAFIRPTVYLSEVVIAEVIDRGIIDGTLHLIARAFYRLGYFLKRFEEKVISDGVDWIKDGFLSLAREFRYLQTGRIQEYVLISTLIATALIAVILLINYGWLARLF